MHTNFVSFAFPSPLHSTRPFLSPLFLSNTVVPPESAFNAAFVDIWHAGPRHRPVPPVPTFVGTMRLLSEEKHDSVRLDSRPFERQIVWFGEQNASYGIFMLITGSMWPLFFVSVNEVGTLMLVMSLAPESKHFIFASTRVTACIAA